MSAVALLARDEGGLSAAGLSPTGVLIGSLLMLGLVAVTLTRTWLKPRFPAESFHSEIPLDGPNSGAAVLLGRIVTVALLALVIIVGLTGSPASGANPVPDTVFSTFWYGGLLVAVVAGGIWTAVHPVAALVEIVSRRSVVTPGPVDTDADPHWWIPAVLLAGFAVLWICWPDGTRPRPAAGFVVIWSAVLMAGGLARGPAWVCRHDPFSLLFVVAGACAPVRWTAGGPRLASPMRHLAARTGTRDRATAAVLAVTLGATMFDAFRVTEGWADLMGTRSLASLAVLNTLAMVSLILVVAVSWMAAGRATALLVNGGDRDGGEGARLALMLAPALAAVVAGNRLGQELDRFLVASQHVIARSSDPFGNGSNLFGTADWIDRQLIPAATTAWLALLVILMGHLTALVVVRDRSVALFGGSEAGRVAWPFTVWLAASLAVAARWMVG